MVNYSNVVDSLQSVIAFHVRDWSLDARDAWIYGIVMGWDSALPEVAGKHGWSEESIERLLQLHAEFAKGPQSPR